MRPRFLEEYFGQSHVLAPGRLLWRAIKADRPPCMIFHGPPGTGKTSLAAVIAQGTRSLFLTLNAVLGGVKEIREAVALAEEHLKKERRRTILFIDEVHRFNKSQQDALLPHAENGLLIFIGATTENPYFEVNQALISRSRVFELKPLDENELRQTLDHAMKDAERGLGRLHVELAEDAVRHLIKTANGDARVLLNAVELAVLSSEPDDAGRIKVDLAVAEESIRKKAAFYDKDGDAHYDVISSFIKSLRGSDVDAALYWMARMVNGGEDPRFILRRMVIFAAEDVGMADPGALNVAVNAAKAFDYVGMPEGRFHLAQACIYLATTFKSNSAFAFFDALSAVSSEKDHEPPDPLKDGSRDRQALNHGKDYLYPHAYRDHWVAQQYLPDALKGRLFYNPSDQGYEAETKARVKEWRSMQIQAASQSGKDAKNGAAYWSERSNRGRIERMTALKRILMADIEPAPNATLLQLNAGEGCFIEEWLAKGQNQIAYLQVQDEAQGDIQKHLGRLNPDRERVRVFLRENTLELLKELGSRQIRFDAILGFNALAAIEDLSKLPAGLREVAGKGSRGRLLENLAEENQPLAEMLSGLRVEPQYVDLCRQTERTLNERKSPQALTETKIRALDFAAWGETRLTRLELPEETRLNLATLNDWLLLNPEFVETAVSLSSRETWNGFRQDVLLKAENEIARWNRPLMLIEWNKA